MLQERGGWLNRDIAGWFADYSALVARRLGDRLASIATINEPWCVAMLGHYYGVHAPGFRDLRATGRSMHHVLLAHGAGIEALRAEGASNLGIILNLEQTEPASAAKGDVATARLWDGLFNRWYLGGVLSGRYPDDITKVLESFLPEGWSDDMARIGQPIDWLGINYYTRAIVEHGPNAGLLSAVKANGKLETTDSSWEIYPQGCSNS